MLSKINFTLLRFTYCFVHNTVVCSCMRAKDVAGCLGLVSRASEALFFFRFFVSGLGLIPKACIVTVGLDFFVKLPILFLVFLMFMTFFRRYCPSL